MSKSDWLLTCCTIPGIESTLCPSFLCHLNIKVTIQLSAMKLMTKTIHSFRIKVWATGMGWSLSAWNIKKKSFAFDNLISKSLNRVQHCGCQSYLGGCWRGYLMFHVPLRKTIYYTWLLSKVSLLCLLAYWYLPWLQGGLKWHQHACLDRAVSLSNRSCNSNWWVFAAGRGSPYLGVQSAGLILCHCPCMFGHKSPRSWTFQRSKWNREWQHRFKLRAARDFLIHS